MQDRKREIMIDRQMEKDRLIDRDREREREWEIDR